MPSPDRLNPAYHLHTGPANLRIGLPALRGDFGVYAGIPRAGELRGPRRHVQTPAVPETLVILTNFGATLADCLWPDPLSVGFPYINFTDFDGIYAGGPRSPQSR